MNNFRSCFSSVYHRKSMVATTFQRKKQFFAFGKLYNLKTFQLLIHPILCKSSKTGLFFIHFALTYPYFAVY